MSSISDKWRMLQGGVSARPYRGLVPDYVGIRTLVLKALECTEEEAKRELGSAFTHAQFTAYDTPAQGLVITAIPFDREITEIVETAYEGLDAEALYSYFTTFLTNHQIENAVRGLCFDIASALRDRGALAEARAYDHMYSAFSGGKNKIDAVSLHNLWIRAGYQPTYLDLRTVTERWK